MTAQYAAHRRGAAAARSRCRPQAHQPRAWGSATLAGGDWQCLISPNDSPWSLCEQQTRSRAWRARRSHRASGSGTGSGGAGRSLWRAPLISLALVVAACGVTLGLINTSTIRPGALDFKALVKASPRQVFAIDAEAPYAWRQPGVLLSTVHQAATLTVPGLGRLEYWLADSTNHWICRAIRLPDGSWIGTNNKYDIGGLVPGCLRPDCEGCAIHVDGFNAYETAIQVPIDGRAWLLFDGTAPTTGHPTAVRDLISGATAPIVDHRYFLIAIPARVCKHGNDWCTPRARFQLGTVNKAGRTLVGTRTSTRLTRRHLLRRWGFAALVAALGIAACEAATRSDDPSRQRSGLRPALWPTGSATNRLAQMSNGL